MLGGMGNNFPVIDKFVQACPKSIAQSITSIKSLDLHAASYQNLGRLFNRIMGYAQKLALFQSTRRGDIVVNVGQSTMRILELAIPSGASAMQMEQINKAIQKALEMGVQIVPIVIR